MSVGLVESFEVIVKCNLIVIDSSSNGKNLGLSSVGRLEDRQLNI